MWWVETKEGIAPGQWGKGGIWLQKARGWGCRDGKRGHFVRAGAQEARHFPSTPFIRERCCKV